MEIPVTNSNTQLNPNKINNQKDKQQPIKDQDKQKVYIPEHDIE